MQELLLRREIFDLLLSGKKHSTSRRGKRDISIGPLLFKMTEDESIQKSVNVTKVSYERFADITQREASMEGYETAEEMRDVLLKIYPETSDEDIFTFVEFE